MKTLFFSFLGTLLPLWNTVFAGDKNIIGEETSKIRNGTFSIDDIPKILMHVAQYLLGFVATLSVIFIIIGAYQWGIGSVTSDVTEGKKKVGMAITGFILASLSWWLVKLVVDNLDM